MELAKTITLFIMALLMLWLIWRNICMSTQLESLSNSIQWWTEYWKEKRRREHPEELPKEPYMVYESINPRPGLDREAVAKRMLEATLGDINPRTGAPYKTPRNRRAANKRSYEKRKAKNNRRKK